MTPSPLSELRDLVDFLQSLNDANAAYLVIGGHAVGLHGHSRATKDLDVWIGTDLENRKFVLAAMQAFGAPPSIVRALEVATPEEFVFLGRPPFRIDLLQTIPGVPDFVTAHAQSVEVIVGDVPVRVLSLEDLIAAKRAAGRPQDLADIDHLEQIRAKVGLS